MARAKTVIFKNNTNHDNIWHGRLIKKGSSKSLTPVEIELFAKNNQIKYDISNGNVIINDGSKDLTPTEGLDYLMLGFVGNDTSNTESSNSIFQLDFFGPWWVGNQWLDVVGRSLSTDEVKAMVPWKSKLIAIGYSNKHDWAEFDIEVHKLGIDGKPGTDEEKIYTWEVRNPRRGTKTDLPDLTVNAGDGISIFIADQGKNADSLVVSLYFEILDKTTQQTLTS